jgi:hypothetical protein
MVDWVKYAEDNITQFREIFSELQREQVMKIILSLKYSSLTLNAPCQIIAIEFDAPIFCFCILHESAKSDKKIIFIKGIKSSKRFDPDVPFAVSLDDLSTIMRNKEVIELIGDEGAEYLTNGIFRRLAFKFHMAVEFDRINLHPSSMQILWILKEFLENQPEPNPKSIARIIMEHIDFEVEKSEKEQLAASAKETISSLEQSVKAIPGVEQRRDAAQKIESLNEHITALEKEIIYLKSCMGETSYGEFQNSVIKVVGLEDRLKAQLEALSKVNEAKVSELNARITSLSNIKEAYDRLFEQQRSFMQDQSQVMQQQSDVIKQQADFVKWIKNAAIFVSAAVVTVSILDLLLRYLSGVT